MEDTRTEEQKRLDQEQISNMYAEIAQAEKEEHEANMKLLEENKILYEDFKNLLDDCSITGKIEIVDKPTGYFQEEIEDAFFKQIFVDQWTTGMEGDSFAGYIYGNFGKDKWLKVPYEC